MDLVFSRTRKIPNKSWGQECSLCSSRHGVPIECSARGCKAAYHTTCAIRGKLKMQAIFGKNFKGGIKLRSYCKEHSPSVNVTANGILTQDDKIDASGVKEIDMTNLADDRLQEDNEELDYFWKYVDINEVHRNVSEAYARAKRIRLASSNDDNSDLDSTPKSNKKCNPSKSDNLGKKSNSPKKIRLKDDKGKQLQLVNDHSTQVQEVDPLMLDLIYRYWMLLRTANNGQSLIKFSPSALKEREFEQRKSILKLRIELERVRNLSYMIGKREKLKASWLKIHQNIIKRTFSVINDLNPTSDAQCMPEETNSANHVLHNHQTASHHQNHHHHHHHHHHQNHHHHTQQGSTATNGRRSLHSPTQHLQQTNGIFDESDQLINDLITCDQIYELPNNNSNSNYSNLSYQEQSTLERRRTLSLVRRINRQLKSVSMEPSLNPYAKSYLAPKRSDSPVGMQQSPTAKTIKYR